MNTVIKSNENQIFELAKRSIFSFQVLIVGVALPFLFLFGISNGNKKKVENNHVKEITIINPVSAKSVMGLYVPGI